MDKPGKRLLNGVKKYKYAALVLLVGIALLLLPSRSSKQEQTVKTEQPTLNEQAYLQEMERRLEETLSQIDGAGEVRVVLTLRSGVCTLYQTDVASSEDDGRKSEERKTVIMSAGSAYNEAAVSSVEYPQFQGALIVCRGAGSASVKLDLINAVASLTGLGSDQITVVKMK